MGIIRSVIAPCDAQGAPRVLTSDAARRFDGDRVLLQPIAAIGQGLSGQPTVDVVGVSEIADRAQVGRDTVQKWRERHDDFPVPMATLAAGPVWSWEAVDRWLHVRRPPGRPSVDTLTDRAWSAVGAALPSGWQAAFVMTGDPAIVTAEASDIASTTRLHGHGESSHSALLDLARELREWTAAHELSGETVAGRTRRGPAAPQKTVGRRC